MKTKSATPGCDQCRKKKKGCDREAPCGLCVANGVRCTYTSAPGGSGGQREFGRLVQGSSSALHHSSSTAPSLASNKENDQYYQKYGKPVHPGRFSAANSADLAAVGLGGGGGGGRDRSASTFTASSSSTSSSYPNPHHPHPYPPYNASSRQNQNHHPLHHQSYSYDYGNNGNKRVSGSSNYPPPNQRPPYNSNYYAPYHLAPSAYYPNVVDPKYLVPFNRRTYTYQRQHDRLRFEEYFTSSSPTASSATTPTSTDPILTSSSVSATPTASRPSSAIGIAKADDQEQSSTASFLGFHASISSQSGGSFKKSGVYNTMHPTSAIPLGHANSPLKEDIYSSAAPMEPQDTAAALLLWQFQIKSSALALR